jgi:hypothetical protein
MGKLTSEKQKELIKNYYRKYYENFYPKYGPIIDFYIKKFFPKKSKSTGKSVTHSKSQKSSSFKQYQRKSQNINASMEKLSKHTFNLGLHPMNIQPINISGLKSKTKSSDFIEFLYDLIYRRILIYELKPYIYNHIQNEDEIMKSLKNPEDYKKLKRIGFGEYGTIYRLDENRCIKFVNITKTLNNLKYIHFIKEIEISKIAGNIGIGPKIYDAYVTVNDQDSSCYGIIYMEYLQGMTLSNYMEDLPKNKYDHIRKLLDEKIAKLHSHNILHSDLHADNVYVILNNRQEFVDVKIIDYGFAQYIQDYIYFRNHYRLNDELFHFSRHYIYHELSNLIFQKIV